MYSIVEYQLEFNTFNVESNPVASTDIRLLASQEISVKLGDAQSVVVVIS